MPSSRSGRYLSRVLGLALALCVARCACAAEGAKRQRKPRVRTVCAPELGLLEGEETARTYAINFQRFCNGSSPWAEQHFVREVLGFVAPWSDHGYRAARYFRGKLSVVSPLWFRVLPGAAGKDAASSFEIAGWDIAREQERWGKQASSEFCWAGRCGDGPEVLPHISIEGFEKLSALRSVLEAPVALAAEITVLCERGAFAGVVFDLRLALFPGLKLLVPQLVAELGRALHAGHRRLVLSVPAPLPGAAKAPIFDAEDAATLADRVDAVVLGTRDFSRKEPGPAAPLPWVRSCVEGLLETSERRGLRPEQLLLEIPLYGRAFQEGAEEGRVIAAGEVAKALARQKPALTWDAKTAEHSAALEKSRVSLSMPTLAFVAARLELARELGVGVALRDLGGGLDAAFDLLPARAEEADTGFMDVHSVDSEAVLDEAAAEEVAAEL